jgi:hypothetical protein
MTRGVGRSVDSTGPPLGIIGAILLPCRRQVTKPTKRNPQVPPDCPPGLSAELQESWASWWKHSSLAPQLDAHDISELKRLWLLYAEEEHLYAVLFEEVGFRRLARPGSKREREELIALVQRWCDVFDEIDVLEDLSLMNPLARAKRETGDFE